MERVRFSTDCLNGSEHLDIRLVFSQVLVYEVLELLVQLKVIGKQKPLLSSLFQNQVLQPRESLILNSFGGQGCGFFVCVPALTVFSYRTFRICSVLNQKLPGI